MDNFDDINQYLRQFAKARDWEQFHSPKNISMALSVECSELMEHFQWLTEEESSALAPSAKRDVEDEIVDVLLYTLRLADILDVNLPAAIARKTEENEAKYPIDKVKGSHKKYNQYE